MKMVQRKVHGSQAGHVQSEKLLGNMKKKNKKKQTSCQNQDGKNMGPDMKKKMKRTSSIRKSMSQSGKTLPFDGQNGEATPRKQLMIRASDGSPNYMKSTSCSEARKERSQVSCSLNTQLGSDSKNLRMSNSSQSKLGSSAKPSRTLTKASSLKLVRTLTKAPSFKPVRGTARKSSRVLFCSDVNVQKSTCSSTLKESKFPAYLMLNPGGTESEGTSATKVCPYSYCSLNGHHHSPLPPLKCFLRARRRSLKTQKSMKSEDASPRKFNPSSGRGCPEDKPLLIEAGLIDTVNSPMTRDVDMDFFVEIYANNKVNDAESTQVSTTEFAGKPEEQKNRSDGSPLLPIDLEERFERCQKSFATIQEQEIKDVVEESSPTWLEEGAAEGGFDRKETERECYTSMEEDNVSEVTNMEWEEDQLPVPELDSEAEHHNIAYLSAMKKGLLFYELDVTNHDEIVSNYTGKVLIDDLLQELYEEETSSFDLHGVDWNTELESVQQETDIVESSQMNSRSVESCDQISFVEEAVEELETDMQATPIPLTESISGAAAAHASTQGDEVLGKENDNVVSNDELENPETYCMNDLKIGTLDGDQEDISFQPDDATMLNDILVIDHHTETGTIAFSSLDQELPKIEVEDAMEEHEKMDDVKSSFGSQNSDSFYSFSEAEEDDTEAVGDSECYNILSPESMPTEVLKVVENQNLLEEDQDGVCKLKIQREQNGDLRMYKVILINENRADSEMKGEESFMSDIAQTLLTDKNRTRSNSDQELLSACNKRKWTTQSKKTIKESEEERKFNPREPNFLPVIPDPEAEKVDLKHQDMDDRKNSEEWMLDYALQKAVTKLAPARKKRVALLVEAFETVLPTPKCPTHIRNRSTAFPHSRPMQACS